MHLGTEVHMDVSVGRRAPTLWVPTSPLAPLPAAVWAPTTRR